MTDNALGVAEDRVTTNSITYKQISETNERLLTKVFLKTFLAYCVKIHFKYNALVNISGMLQS